MRLTAHEDGWIYGVFCTERRDPAARRGDLSSAVAQCGIARTRDLETWERLPDLVTRSPQQRNVVLHPELVGGAYAFYTRPQDGFIEAGSGGGIGWGLAESIERAVIGEEVGVHDRALPHDLRGQERPRPAADPDAARVAAARARGARHGGGVALRAVRVHDRARRAVAGDPRARRPSAGACGRGARRRRRPTFSSRTAGSPAVDGEVFVYYASSDTRCHVATTTVDTLVDYCRNTPPDPGRSAACVRQRLALIERNLKLLRR